MGQQCPPFGVASRRPVEWSTTESGARGRALDSTGGRVSVGRMTTEPVLVIGATGGIGSSLCRRLVERGLRVVGAARDEGRLQALKAELGIEFVVTDATRSADVDALVQGTAQRFGRLDGVTSCVGSLLLKPAHRISDEEWLSTISTNLSTAFFTVRAAVRAMQPPGGSVALVSSVAAHLGLPNHEAIAAAKGGVEALVRSAAASFHPDGRQSRHPGGRRAAPCSCKASERHRGGQAIYTMRSHLLVHDRI